MKGAFVDFILQVAHGCHGRTVVEKSVAVLAAVSDPLDLHTALFAQGLDAPNKLVTSHTPSVGQNCPDGKQGLTLTPGPPIRRSRYALALLPVIGFRDRRRGLVAGVSIFVLGILMEGGQHFSPGRAVEFGDVIANGAGVSCGALLGLPVRASIAIL